MKLEGYTISMPASPERKTLFDLCAGHPALDFVNSLDNRFRDDGPDEMLGSYGDLLRFLEESALLDPQRARSLRRAVTPETGERVLQSARALREATASVFYATMTATTAPATSVRVLEKYFLDATRQRELRWEVASRGAGTDASKPRTRPGWIWGYFENEPELPVWLLSQSVANILLSEQITRVRACAVDTCRWLFLDTSKNHTRRWCNMRVCGNRMKARRFQAARRDS
jgi:predicted RNA-binding Zn ribbon-like protein